MSNEDEAEEILAVVEASAPRRWLGMGMLAALGAAVLYVALATPPAFGWQIFLIAAGVSALWLAVRLHQATEHRIELTAQELRSSDGTRIALLSEIDRLDRGTFAFKPSNGFLIFTKNPGGRNWQPGLWWRFGRRIGIGGVTPASQAKYMSELIALRLAERDQTFAGT